MKADLHCFLINMYVCEDEVSVKVDPPLLPADPPLMPVDLPFIRHTLLPFQSCFKVPFQIYILGFYSRFHSIVLVIVPFQSFGHLVSSVFITFFSLNISKDRFQLMQD